ncbi:MAG TPA: hypothetical protein VLA61_26565 [Ideonella sp.]|uniref:hypothetical protein n=1 Tax=Ideonella sp. TaxID=1929293 RepID=UPI002C8DA4E4|nr:hypothetical protein [Ideonella sp.]HSI51847.1 hypothetical protein [Ideonella sp.]
MVRKVMLIRHGEKPSEDGVQFGVGPRGQADDNGLSVRGWQRAGALVRLFSPLSGQAIRAGLAVPSALFAPATVPSGSERPRLTLLPLAEMLSMPIRSHVAKGDEASLAELARTTDGVVLVCWSHQGLSAIARDLVGGDQWVPSRWPADRFDMVWIIDFDQGRTRFTQVPQCLLAGDSAAAIV